MFAQTNRAVIFLICIILFLSGGPGPAYQLRAASLKAMGVLIISNDICIVVKSPTRQLSNTPGQAPLSITLRDRETIVTVQGSYLAIAVPLGKLRESIRRYHLDKLNLIE